MKNIQNVLDQSLLGLLRVHSNTSNLGSSTIIMEQFKEHLVLPRIMNISYTYLSHLVKSILLEG